jgi:regulator of sigma E protease
MIYIISTILVLGILILVHELGHFLAAKLVGIRVETFSIGYPPKIFAKQYGETSYQVGWIPLGGYVKMSGMIDESFDTEFAGQEAKPYEYRAKPAWAKIFVTSAGVIMNLLLAAIIFFVLTWQSGVPEMAKDPVVSSVNEGYPAEAAGLQAGDRILKVNNHAVDSWEGMTKIIHALPNTEISLTYQRGAAVNTVSLTTVSTKTVNKGKIETIGLVGIAGQMEIREVGMIEALGQGFTQTWYWLKLTVNSLGLLITGQESMKNVGGPIMIAQLAGESAKSGLASLFSFIAIISVNLALINILPIPALDGGHIILALWEGVTRREISTKAKLVVQQIGTILLLSLIVLVIFNDITRLFK